MDEKNNEKSNPKNVGAENEEKLKSRKKKRFRVTGNKTRVAGAVYVALAVCVVTVMVLSVYSVNTDPGDINPGDFSIVLPEISKPEISKPPEQSEAEIPVNNEESNVPVETKPLHIRPATGEIIRGYAMTSLVYSTTMDDYRTHSGVDIAGNIGDAVKCYTDGYVTDIRDDAFMGKTVVITHGYGLKSVYQNLAETVPTNVYLGAEVKAGDIIGAIGETAIIESADAPHVHFELILDGNTIDSERELKLIE